MTTSALPLERTTGLPIARILRAAALTFVADAVFGFALAIYNGSPSPVVRFFQGIASVLLGKQPDNGGATALVLGIAMHFTVALFWSTVFALVLSRVRALREMLDSPGGAWKVAAVYGPLIWTSMSLIVIATLLGRMPTINARWWIMFVGHIPSAGFPIAATFRTKGR